MSIFRQTAIILSTLMVMAATSAMARTSQNDEYDHTEAAIADLYQDMQLSGVVDYMAFEQAIVGYNNIDNRQKDILVLIDFSKPSTEERMYVFDMEEKKLLYNTHVAHGRNSGDKYATKFSNRPGSYQSSLGFYLTGNTYQGSNGYSLVLYGLEKGINDKARERAIVIHGAEYCNPGIIKTSGRLGRSYGCPALPPELSKPVIDTIKDGALIFIYANDTDYRELSPILSTSL